MHPARVLLVNSSKVKQTFPDHLPAGIHLVRPLTHLPIQRLMRKVGSRHIYIFIRNIYVKGIIQVGPTASHPQLPHHPQRQQSRSIPEGDVRRRTSHQTGPSSLTRLLRRRRRRSKCNATQPPPLSSPSPCAVLFCIGLGAADGAPPPAPIVPVFVSSVCGFDCSSERRRPSPNPSSFWAGRADVGFQAPPARGGIVVRLLR